MLEAGIQRFFINVLASQRSSAHKHSVLNQKSSKQIQIQF